MVIRTVKEKTLTPSEALRRTFVLSSLILAGDTRNALNVVVESLDEWKVDWNAQKQRTYHQGRSDRTPNKIILNRPALLQHIVCKHTSIYETSHETAFLNGEASLTERTLVLRFVKHLLYESAGRSFYVAIGVCRVLHKYDHATTKQFYGVLDQRDQTRLVDGQFDNKIDGSYRTCKMRLVNSLESRFENFVSVVHLSRNEKRFVSNDQPEAWAEYLSECLELLTPWETEHILPPEFVPTQFNITELKCNGRHEWDSAEEHRMHIIIDPECFSRLAKACKALAPEKQIDIPRFKGVEPGPGGGLDQTEAPPQLTVDQVNFVLDELQKRGTRRRVAVSEHLSIEVDGVECGTLDTANNSGIRLDLNPESKQIQVFTTDAEGKLLLASLWLSLIDIMPDTGWQSAIVLEGGQRLGIDIKPVLDSAAEFESLAVLISYKESNPLRILSHHFQQFREVISEAFVNHRRQFAAIILFVAVALGFIFNQGGYRPNLPVQEAGATINRVDPHPGPLPEPTKHFIPDGPHVAGVAALYRKAGNSQADLEAAYRSDWIPVGQTSESSFSLSPGNQPRTYPNRFALAPAFSGFEEAPIASNTDESGMVLFAPHSYQGGEFTGTYYSRVNQILFPLGVFPTGERAVFDPVSTYHCEWKFPFIAREEKPARIFERYSEKSLEERSVVFSGGISRAVTVWERHDHLDPFPDSRSLISRPIPQIPKGDNIAPHYEPQTANRIIPAKYDRDKLADLREAKLIKSFKVFPKSWVPRSPRAMPISPEVDDSNELRDSDPATNCSHPLVCLNLMAGRQGLEPR